mgnify:CR=1 FL=1
MNERGFSLLETLVALAVLVAAMLGPITLATQSVRAISRSQNQITAVFLAQDAIEYIRARKVTNSFQERTWLADLGGPSGPSLCFHTQGCLIDSLNNTVTLSPICNEAVPPQSCFVGRNTLTGAYGHESGSVPTIFMRRVFMERICADGPPPCGIDGLREVSVRVEVLWKDRSLDRSIEVETAFFCFERTFLSECNT